MRSFNYTDRKKIFRDSFSMSVSKNNADQVILEVDFPDFLALEYEFNSKVLLEAYNKNIFTRFDCGTVGNIVSKDSYVLDDFYDAEDILFRLKVVSDVGSRLEGVADRIRQDSDSHINDSIINIKSIDLFGEVWSIEFSDENPTVLLDKSIDKNLITSNSIFTGLVIPAVFREVLIRILVAEQDSLIIDYENTQMGEDWRMDWLIFCGQNTGKFLEQDVFNKMDTDEKYAWVDRIVAVFCRKKSLLDSLISSIDTDL